HIRSFEYRVDGGEWKPVVCEDGIFDGFEESFAFPLPELKAGKHTVTVRARDRESNIGTASKMVEVK
ncbi:MAG: Ig-like domain-containing protein, partial [Planctomycetota bacterium]